MKIKQEKIREKLRGEEQELGLLKARSEIKKSSLL